MSRTAIATCIGTLWIALAVPAAAQSLQDLVRNEVTGARLGSGYGQILNLVATPDISAARYDIEEDDSQPSIDVVRVPYQARWLALSDDADLYWKVAGGYLQLKDDLALNVQPSGGGTISSKWSAYSLTAGLLARLRLGSGFSLAPALDLGIARLENRADYAGAATSLQPFFDGVLFNWRTNAWLVTPSIGLEWRMAEAARRTSVRGHVARSWISSFDESDPVLKFSETANVYSIRAEHAAPTGVQMLGRPLDWVLYGGYAGFFGANRDALGFTSVAELGAGMEVSLTPRENSDRIRLGASYLFGPDVEGWTVSLGLQY